MTRKPDVVRDFPAYVKDSPSVTARLAEVQKLRDAGKLSQARDLLKEIEATASYRRAKRFEQRYAPKPR